jgi:hypothetical protein
MGDAQLVARAEDRGGDSVDTAARVAQPQALEQVIAILQKAGFK